MTVTERTFTMIIERDQVTSWLVGEVVELPGCHTQAPDMPALEANIRESIDLYLGTIEPDEALSDFVGTWQVKIPA